MQRTAYPCIPGQKYKLAQTMADKTVTTFILTVLKLTLRYKDNNNNNNNRIFIHNNRIFIQDNPSV